MQAFLFSLFHSFKFSTLAFFLKVQYCVMMIGKGGGMGLLGGVMRMVDVWIEEIDMWIGGRYFRVGGV